MEELGDDNMDVEVGTGRVREGNSSPNDKIRLCQVDNKVALVSRIQSEASLIHREEF